MAAFDNYTLVTDTTTNSPEGVTFAWEELNAKNQRRNVYYALHGVIGLLAICSNGFVLYVYSKRAKVRKHISFIMLNVFITCFIHGWIVGLIYPLQRVYRFSMPDWACIVTTMIMDYADRYTLLILPVLAAERLWYVKFPFLRREKTKRIAVISTIVLLLFAALYSWLPLIPNLTSTTKFIESPNEMRQQEISEFYQAYTCNYKINKKNSLEPYFMLAISALCVSVVMIVYVWMFFIVRDRLHHFPNMSDRRKYKLKRAAISVALVSLTFIFTMLPYGIIFPVRALCDMDVSLKQNSLCNNLTIELRFVFSIVSHIGYVLAPLIFALLSPHIRQALKQPSKSLYPCCQCATFSKLFKRVARSSNSKQDEEPDGMNASLTDSQANRRSAKSVLSRYESYMKRNGSYVTAPTEPQQTILSVPPEYL